MPRSRPPTRSDTPMCGRAKVRARCRSTTAAPRETGLARTSARSIGRRVNSRPLPRQQDPCATDKAGTFQRLFKQGVSAVAPECDGELAVDSAAPLELSNAAQTLSFVILKREGKAAFADPRVGHARTRPPSRSAGRLVARLPAPEFVAIYRGPAGYEQQVKI